MNFRLVFMSIGLTSLALSSRSSAEISLAPIFGDDAILQREKPLPIWGRAEPGEKIAVKFQGQSVFTTTSADGRWIVYLEPLAASAEPADLVVEGKTTVTLHGVLVGELWLASGQSNIEWPLKQTKNAAKDIAEANLPLVRQLKIERTVATAPTETARTSGWRTATPATAGEFGAVEYFFARDLQRKLGVPVGVINSSWGGTAIESWMSDAARRSTSIAATLESRWQHALSEWPPERVARYPGELDAWLKADAQAHATHTKNPLEWPQPPASPDSPAAPGGVFNAMIAPLQPCALRGIIWYQGESNAANVGEYAELFTTLIRTWRANWGQGDLPFYFVQLPNYSDNEPLGRKWARLREAQTKALALPATGMAVTIDVGEPENLHPTDKLPVGRRLALLAKALTYGVPCDYSGPSFVRTIREGSTMRVQFSHVGTGLVAHDRPVQALEIAGADRVFHAASGRIVADALIVSSPAVKEPVAVRYAWFNAPVANLYNGAGLPAAPFRSDSW
jgi:sialate O-acetylesterase